jgi:hypothetical protein
VRASSGGKRPWNGGDCPPRPSARGLAPMAAGAPTWPAIALGESASAFWRSAESAQGIRTKTRARRKLCDLRPQGGESMPYQDRIRSQRDYLLQGDGESQYEIRSGFEDHSRSTAPIAAPQQLGLPNSTMWRLTAHEPCYSP